MIGSVAIVLAALGVAATLTPAQSAFVDEYRQMINLSQEFDRCSRFGRFPSAPVVSAADDTRMRDEVDARLNHIRLKLGRIDQTQLRDRAWADFEQNPGPLWHCESLSGSHARTMESVGRVEAALMALEGGR